MATHPFDNSPEMKAQRRKVADALKEQEEWYKDRQAGNSPSSGEARCSADFARRLEKLTEEWLEDAETYRRDNSQPFIAEGLEKAAHDLGLLLQYPDEG